MRYGGSIELVTGKTSVCLYSGRSRTCASSPPPDAGPSASSAPAGEAEVEVDVDAAEVGDLETAGDRPRPAALETLALAFRAILVVRGEAASEGGADEGGVGEVDEEGAAGGALASADGEASGAPADDADDGRTPSCTAAPTTASSSATTSVTVAAAGVVPARLALLGAFLLDEAAPFLSAGPTAAASAASAAAAVSSVSTAASSTSPSAAAALDPAWFSQSRLAERAPMDAPNGRASFGAAVGDAADEEGARR